jgi:hypothetical protein
VFSGFVPTCSGQSTTGRNTRNPAFRKENSDCSEVCRLVRRSRDVNEPTSSLAAWAARFRIDKASTPARPPGPCARCHGQHWAREEGAVAWRCVPCAQAEPGWTFQDPDEAGMHDE